jgi:hypothetical protein
MKYTDKRTTQSRWRAFGSMALAAAAVAVIGFTSVAPAKAYDDYWGYHRGWRERREEWRERREEWRERHPYAGFYYSAPQPYGYYEYHYYR